MVCPGAPLPKSSYDCLFCRCYKDRTLSRGCGARTVPGLLPTVCRLQLPFHTAVLQHCPLLQQLQYCTDSFCLTSLIRWQPKRFLTVFTCLHYEVIQKVVNCLVFSAVCLVVELAATYSSDQ